MGKSSSFFLHFKEQRFDPPKSQLRKGVGHGSYAIGCFLRVSPKVKKRGRKEGHSPRLEYGTFSPSL
jgi:hypothetical protein